MRVLSDGRVRRTAAEWRGMVERHERSGLSVSTFCRQEKLSRNSFTKWRRRLALDVRPGPAFVEWVAPADSSETKTSEAAQGEGTEFELSLPGGVVLRWTA